MQQILEREGYEYVRQLPTGEWVGVLKFLYTYGLMVGLDASGYRRRFCYAAKVDAAYAAAMWSGAGDPPGLWIKEKGEVERLGPGAIEEA